MVGIIECLVIYHNVDSWIRCSGEDESSNASDFIRERPLEEFKDWTGVVNTTAMLPVILSEEVKDLRVNWDDIVAEKLVEVGGGGRVFGPELVYYYCS